MNKKKFLATCTLVAFGSTMLPAMAFAAAGPTPDPTEFVNGATGFVDLVNAGFDIEFDGIEETWLSADDTLIVKVADSASVGANILEDASKKFSMAVTQVADSPSTAGTIKITPVDGATFIPGYYAVSVIDKEDNTKVSDVVVIKAPLDLIDSTVESGATVSGGAVTNPEKVNCITVTNSDLKTNTAVFDLGEQSYAQIPEGAKAVAILGANGIPVKNLVVGHFYAVAGTTETMATATYPVVIFEYTAEAATDVEKAVDAAQKWVDADSAKIPDTVTFALANGYTASDIQITAASGAELGVTESLGSNNKIFIASGLSVNGQQIIKTDSFDQSTGVFAALGSAHIIANDVFPLLANGDITGTMTVAVQNSDNNFISEKTVKVVLTKAVSQKEAVANYATKYLSDYNTTDNTAKLILSAIDEGINLDSVSYVNNTGSVVKATPAITGASYEMSKYLDIATGKVTKIPTADITENVTLTVAATPITVALTIKAAGEEDPSLEEATEALNTEIVAYGSLVDDITADNRITDDEYAQFKAAQEKVIAAYQAYKAAGGQD